MWILKLNFQQKKWNLWQYTQNVVAVLEGTDPLLKNEYVFYGAHYDHIGITRNGAVSNGADDDGSGTVSLLEIAQAYQNNPQKRSIVMMWHCGEEKGLWGAGLGDEAAGVGDADDHRLGPSGRRRLDRHFGKAEGGAATVEPELAKADLRPPLEHAAGRLGREIVARIAEEEQVGLIHGVSAYLRRSRQQELVPCPSETAQAESSEAENVFDLAKEPFDLFAFCAGDPISVALHQ